ncbi:hypothetical protein BDF20DRAFT_907120 [Mycotypha africana]|uniref:uncharacterized protein n=1 Tax=Mycotypha africana TaxID=64632 RepID=UPI0022FFE73B|nr:uncharacterized protein BDF20DRAFT_907120 [Mycotypha africana]KAI8973631.1 hypothetical protein BDF20DRAFT_907120 [Mycotypha africana]
MDSPPAFILVDAFIAGLFHHASSWKDVLSLLLVCQQFNYIGQKQAINVPFHINADFGCGKFAAPSTMATVVHIDCNSYTEEAVFNYIVTSFTSCFVVGINFNDLNKLSTIKKICKTVLRKGISLDILDSCNTKVHDIIYTLTKKYSEKYKDYKMKQSGSKLIKRKHSEDDFIMLRVPKDTRLRQKFSLAHLLHIDVLPNVNSNVENPFATISHITMYKDIINISFFTSGFDEASSQIQQFINCIIKFNGFSLLVNSFDVFYHNHKYYDDCAHALNRIDRVITARVSRKTYTDKQFMEISIFAGYYELLVVAGYIHKHGSITPFLGSSVGNFKLDEDTTTCIKVPALASEFICTKRLLNQYVKRRSHNLWGFHCARSFAGGIYPISPIELMNHASQKARMLNNHHFNSVVLHLFSSPKAIKSKDLEALWSLIIRLPFFKTKMEAVSTTPTNFAEMSDILKKIKDDSHTGSLIHILGSLQLKTPCFFLSLYGETVAKDIALKIVTPL